MEQLCSDLHRKTLHRKHVRLRSCHLLLVQFDNKLNQANSVCDTAIMCLIVWEWDTRPRAIHCARGVSGVTVRGVTAKFGEICGFLVSCFTVHTSLWLPLILRICNKTQKVQLATNTIDNPPTLALVPHCRDRASSDYRRLQPPKARCCISVSR